MLTILLTAFLSCPQAGNQIVLTDGTIVEVDKINSETYSEVSYKRGSSTINKDSAEIAEVRHALGHSKLEDYAAGVDAMNLGDFEGAIFQFRAVVADEKLISRATFSWVNQHARFREIRCLYSLAMFQEVANKVDALILAVPDTFFFAPALLMKARALNNMSNQAGAKAVYDKLSEEVSLKSLSLRWENEAELGKVLLDSDMTAQAKQRELQAIAEKNAASFPIVSARARVEVGHAMVEGKEYEKAYDFFLAILEDESTPEPILASAISGMGDCSYRQALASDSLEEQKPMLENAVLDFLTVASVYREQVEFVPRAMFYAGDALKRIGDTASAKRVASRLNKLFPNSTWKAKLFKELNLR